MAWQGSIKVGASEGGRVLVLYRGEFRVYDLTTPENVEKLRRIASTSHVGAMQFVARFPRVPEAEKAHVESLKQGRADEFKTILDSIRVAPKVRTPDPKKGKGK